MRYSYLDALGKLRHPRQLEKILQNIIKRRRIITKNQRVTERLILMIALSEVRGQA